MSSYLSAIRHLQISAGCEAVSRAGFPRLQYILKGISRLQPSSPRSRLPITGQVMRALLLAWSSGVIAEEYDARLLWAAACAAFFGFLRLGEVVPPTSNSPAPILVGDVKVLRSASSSMIRIHLKRSKTDPLGKGINIFLGATGQDICPVTALSNFLFVRPKGQGPLFVLADGAPLLRSQFIEKVRKALSYANIDEGKYSGHSFRIGAATSAAAAGVPDHMIKMMGRWESSAYLLYLRTPRESLAALSGQLIAPCTSMQPARVAPSQDEHPA